MSNLELGSVLGLDALALRSLCYPLSLIEVFP